MDNPVKSSIVYGLAILCLTVKGMTTESTTLEPSSTFPVETTTLQVLGRALEESTTLRPPIPTLTIGRIPSQKPSPQTFSPSLFDLRNPESPAVAEERKPLQQEILETRYIVPVEVNNEVDRFSRGKKEYYFHNPKLNYYLANEICMNKYKGRLAWIRDNELANFLAEALSETRLEMDTLWTGGRKSNEDSEWKWQDVSRTELISTNITSNIVSISEVVANNRHCLGFGRKNHYLPQFRALACSAERSVLCESNRRPSDSDGSTHHGWITLGKYQYKIFQNRVVWNTSNAECNYHDSNAKLASVFSYEIAQELGRYLLIGRPSLDNAWIGGKWDGNGYKWMEFNRNIPNITNSNYPPWKNNKVIKKHGCILLDRHVSNTTVFVEARCERQRPYICYRNNKDSQDIEKTDVVINNNGYRLILTKMTWEDACNFCSNYKNYGGKLAEIRDTIVKNELLYVMGDNKTAIQHIWLAGRFNMSTDSINNRWYWESDKSVIPLGQSPLQWIQNTTYVNDVEELNVCLNMDRENHRTAFHYGTVCSEPQNFICAMPKDRLFQLQIDEENNSVVTDASVRALYSD